MKNRFLILLWFLFTIAGFKSVAQNQKTEPLVNFLHLLEQQFDVVFTYADENIHDISISISHDDLSLDNGLLELEKQTNLDFRRIDSRYIAIQRRISDSWVSGTIVDKNTNEKIADAVISASKNYVLSDESGYFSIKTNRTDSLLVIRYAGYKPLRLITEAWGNDSSIYELVPDVQILKEVVVNYIAKGIDKLPDGSVQMNIQNMETLPGLSEPDVLHTVQVLPGIQSLNETVANINMRGGTNDQSMILWDGVKMYQTGHFFGLISAFNSQLIHQTRIIKNGANAFYNEGISGIIDMKQQDYLVNDFEVSSGINMISADMIMKVPASRRLSFILGARHSINDFVLTPTYKSYYKRAFENTKVQQNQQQSGEQVDKFHDFGFYDLSFKLLYDVTQKDKLRFSFLNINNLIKYEESAVVQDKLRSNESQLNQSSILANLLFSHSWNERHSAQLSLYTSLYNLDGINVLTLEDETHIQENEVVDYGLKIDSKNVIGQSVVLLSGYQFKEIGIRNLDNLRNPRYFRDAKDVLRIHAIYTDAEVRGLAERLYLRTGLRTSYFTKFEEFLFEPEIVLNYKFSDSFLLEASVEKKTQHTTQLIDYQTDFLGVEKRRWVLSNKTSIPFLDVQQYSVGIQYNQNNFLVSLEGYQKKVTGIITPSQGFQNQYESVYSTGEYSTEGLELLMSKRYKQSNFWVNYTIAQNDYFFEEFTPSIFPNNFDVRHTISLGGIYSIKQFELSSGINFRTGTPFTEPSQENLNYNNEIVYEASNSSRLDDYFRLDISGRYKFRTEKVKVELGVSIWNILDRDNIINIYYRLNDKNEIEQFTRHALGITPNVSLRLKF